MYFENVVLQQYIKNTQSWAVNALCGVIVKETALNYSISQHYSRVFLKGFQNNLENSIKTAYICSSLALFALVSCSVVGLSGIPHAQD